MEVTLLETLRWVNNILEERPRIKIQRDYIIIVLSFNMLQNKQSSFRHNKRNNCNIRSHRQKLQTPQNINPPNPPDRNLRITSIYFMLEIETYNIWYFEDGVNSEFECQELVETAWEDIEVYDFVREDLLLWVCDSGFREVCWLKFAAREIQNVE